MWGIILDFVVLHTSNVKFTSKFILFMERKKQPPSFKARCVKAIHVKQFVSHSASLKLVDKRLMCLCKEEEEVKDEGMERGREGRKDEGIPDALLLRRSQGSEWVYRKSKVSGTVTPTLGREFLYFTSKLNE